MLRLSAIFVGQLLLWSVVSLMNTYLATQQVYAYTGGLFVCYAGLFMGRREGLASAIFTGFLFDAASTVPFGQHAMLHAIGFTLLFLMRPRLGYTETTVQILVVLGTNLGLFLLKSILQIGDMVSITRMWDRLLWDIGASSLILILITPWALALQARCIDLVTPGGFKRSEQD